MISYTIKPERRNNYLTLIAEIKNHIVNIGKNNYTVFEAKGKKNQFTELYIFNSEGEFDALDDSQDPQTQELLGRLESFVEGSMKYTTALEV